MAESGGDWQPCITARKLKMRVWGTFTLTVWEIFASLSPVIGWEQQEVAGAPSELICLIVVVQPVSSCVTVEGELF